MSAAAGGGGRAGGGRGHGRPRCRCRGERVPARPGRAGLRRGRRRGAWYGVLRRGVARVAGLTVAGLALAGAVALIVAGGRAVRRAAGRSWGSWSLWRRRGRRCTSMSSCRSAPAPRRPVLFFNPKSGGGKAERFKLADEARARGIEPIELGPPWDLEALVRGAVDRGADALAMAGGDGSQAIVAAVAAEHGLPYACIPAGTRNHFALDLGVDRDDVVGALDAFVDGGERTRRPRRGQRARVRQQRLARPLRRGGPARGLPRREAAHDPRHRARRPRARRRAGSTCAGPGPAGTSTGRARRSWSPTTATGSAARSARARARGSTTACSGSRSSARPDRPRRAAAARPQRPWREWSAPTFEVESDGPVAAGIDGEALVLDAAAALPHPARRPARAHRPHSTPAPRPRPWLPRASGPALLELVRIARGRPRGTRNPTPKDGRNGPDGDHREGAR